MKTLTIEQTAAVLGTDPAGVVNLIEMGRLAALPGRPARVEAAEAERCRRELEREHAAFLEFLKAGEEMDFRDGDA